MAQLVVRNREDEVKMRIQLRARRHGRSLEEEVPRKPLGSRLRDRFAGMGLEDELPEWRGEIARPAGFEARASGVLSGCQSEAATARRA